ncbi:hypothetical protein ZWY2020_039847 [Hordeum vulgare]|nr:hypothetical protein ZWY2020_039847 [Hordeum vulgare]
MTPHWRAKVEALSHESASKKRPRAAATKQAGNSQVKLPSWKMVISTEAKEAIGTLALLRLNEGATYHATNLGRELQAIAQLGNEPFFLAGRLKAAVSALHDLMATVMMEGEEATPALKELTVRLYKLQFLIPICIVLVQGYAPTQMAQNQAVTVSYSQQQSVAVRSTQQQQAVVVAPSAVPQEQVVGGPSAGDEEQVVGAPSAGDEEQVVAAQQQPVMVAPSAGDEEQVVAAQQQPVMVAPSAGDEEVAMPLVEEQVVVKDQVYDVNDQNVEEHHGQGDGPFNILMGHAELDQLLQLANQFLGAGQGDPPPPV